MWKELETARDAGSMLRRIIFLLCWLPAFAFFALRWVATGKDILDGLDAFQARWLS